VQKFLKLASQNSAFLRRYFEKFCLKIFLWEKKHQTSLCITQKRHPEKRNSCDASLCKATLIVFNFMPYYSTSFYYWSSDSYLHSDALQELFRPDNLRATLPNISKANPAYNISGSTYRIGIY